MYSPVLGCYTQAKIQRFYELSKFYDRNLCKSITLPRRNNGFASRMKTSEDGNAERGGNIPKPLLKRKTQLYTIVGTIKYIVTFT